jgi:hypothetical protein
MDTKYRFSFIGLQKIFISWPSPFKGGWFTVCYLMPLVTEILVSYLHYLLSAHTTAEPVSNYLGFLSLCFLVVSIFRTAVLFIWHVRWSILYTDKKENKIFFIYREIQMGSGAKSYTRKGYLIYCMRKCTNIFTIHMRRSVIIYDFAPDLCTLNFLIYEGNIIFFFTSVQYTSINRPMKKIGPNCLQTYR